METLEAFTFVYGIYAVRLELSFFVPSISKDDKARPLLLLLSLLLAVLLLLQAGSN